ncbi:hypothetical protein [Cellulomonas uda]|nr:hypothetical protein [Cellulomonas uda]NII65099.1 hypothetical protein [Cellulomonas uda]
MPHQSTHRDHPHAPGAWAPAGDEAEPGHEAEPGRETSSGRETTTAWDGRRLARVTLDAHGSPAAVQVVDGWERHAAADDLAAAVLDAARTAARTLDERAWASLTDDADRRRRAPSAPVASAPVASPAPAGTPRPLDELAEIAITSLSAASQADDAAAVGTGSALDHEIEVRVVRGGIVGVTLRGPRVARTSGTQLSRLLTGAVRAAVTDLQHRLAAQAPAVSDALLAEVLAHLRALTADPASAGDRT